MKILVVGAAGFIGMYTSLRLLARGDLVVGVDNLNDYYDITLKEARLERLTTRPNFSFHKLDLAGRQSMAEMLPPRGSFILLLGLDIPKTCRMLGGMPVVPLDEGLRRVAENLKV